MKRKFALIYALHPYGSSLGRMSKQGSGISGAGDPQQPSNVKDATYSGFTGSYDADKWLFDSSLGLFAIYDKEVYEAGNPGRKVP